MNTQNEKIDSLEKIVEEICIHEAAIKNASESINTARVGSMKYFWPFLVLSIFQFIGMWIYSEMQGLYLWCAESPDASGDFKADFIALAIGIFFLIHLIGGALARYFQGRRNGALEADELNKKKIIKKSEERILELKTMKKEILEGKRAKAVKEGTEAPAIVTNPMSREELAAKKTELKTVEKAIEVCSSELSKVTKKIPCNKHNSMEYFWPLLIASFFAQGQVYIIGCWLENYVLGLGSQGFAPFLISAVPFVLIHIIGGHFTRKKAIKENQVIDEKRDALHIEENRIRNTMSEFNLKKKKLMEEIEQAGA